MAGTDFGELDLSASTIAAFAVAFSGSVALWWIYFDRGAEAGRRAISSVVLLLAATLVVVAAGDTRAERAKRSPRPRPDAPGSPVEGYRLACA